MTGNVEFRQAEATEFQNFLKSNASFIMNNINMVSQSVESLKSTYKTSETESIFNEVERGLKKFENDYNTINQKYYDTLEKVKLNYQLAESQNSAVFTDVGSNMHAASLALGSGAMTAAGFDFGKISTNAQDATSGKFVNKVDVSAFNEKSDYTFTYRKDGSVLVSKNGTAIGYTTVENANKVTGGKFVGNTNPSNNDAGGNDSNPFSNSNNLTNQGYPNSASEQTTTGGTNNFNATNNYAGGKVVIAYSAVLNDKANINQLDNHNEAVLEFTKDSKVDSGQVPGIIERPKDKTYTYTFDIDGTVTGSVTGGIITKFGEEDKDEDGKNDPLNGAVFTLYTQDPTGLTGEVLEKAIYKNYTVDESGNKTPLFDGTVTSVDGGQLPIKGLAAGTTGKPATYYLKETTAPSGYSLNTHVFKIQISATYITDDGDNKGKLESWTITIDDNPINTFSVTHEGNNATAPEFNSEGVDIQNTKLSSLPSTGGIGTTIFTIGGCAIMILAAGLYFASRRKSAK